VRLVGALAGVLVAGAAHADTPPTIWDLGKNSNAFAQRRAHVAIEQQMERYDVFQQVSRPEGAREMESAREAVRELLEPFVSSAPGALPMDTWLRFDLGWLHGRSKRWPLAIPILEGVVKELGPHPFTQEVWERLADAYVHAERTDDEIHAYDEVLARATSDSERLTPMLNQGEALMRAGDAEAALPQFREVLRLSGMVLNANEVGLLAQWDLALALDRSGDPTAGLKAALDAVRQDRRCVALMGFRKVYLPGPDPDVAIYLVPPGLFPISEENTQVYFVPDYEREWYLALGYQALALDAGKQQDRATNLRDAETYMMSYVSHATLHGSDKWLELGKKRLDTIRRRRAEAQARAGVSRP
jgi:tetratricopeptide (TPR) repeat protein